VLRAVVTSYVGEGAPIGSRTLSHLLPVPLSSASIRTTLGELAEIGLIEKPHASAGRVPTEQGLRRFVDELLPPSDVADWERRDIHFELEEAEGEGVMHVASGLLSRHSHQLGFVVAAPLARAVLRHLSFVRLTRGRVLVVLVAQTGRAYQCVIEDEHGFDQADLDRAAALLNERVAGLTLPDVRERLAHEAKALRREANRLLLAALDLGSRALEGAEGRAGDVVIETRVQLLEQPEFSDPRRLRELFEALETREGLLELLDRMLDHDGVSVAFGAELADPGLRRCALVAAPWGAAAGERSQGVLGVIGPTRMDYRRVIPLVEYLAGLITSKLAS
jgi:heat-inducible transcriptional repressor